LPPTLWSVKPQKSPQQCVNNAYESFVPNLISEIMVCRWFAWNGTLMHNIEKQQWITHHKVSQLLKLSKSTYGEWQQCKFTTKFVTYSRCVNETYSIWHPKKSPTIYFLQG
jgi:hypothetical protein